METSLPPGSLSDVLARLREANLAVTRAYPGQAEGRQPVHTVYGGAHLFRADSARKLGALALRALDEHAPDAGSFAAAMGLPHGEQLAADVLLRVREKLAREPVEDLRIDFEDGYGLRPAAEEDGHAVAAATELARGLAAGGLPPFCGLRIKSLGEETRERALRTLDLFVTALCRQSGGVLPAGFVVTLPKVTGAVQVSALSAALGALERALGLGDRALSLEIMIETTQAVFDADGRLAPRALVEAAGGRCVAAHFGTYDYTASCGVAAGEQRHDHPAADFARHAMQIALAGTGVRLSDGATVTMPVGPHRAPAAGRGPLSPAQLAENTEAVHRGWQLHFRNVSRSLSHGFYQGWDLHPAQLPARYAAVHAFFLQGVDEAAARLKNFVERAAQASLLGGAFDDAATGQGLLNYFLMAMNAGALTADEASLLTSLTPAQLRGRSFASLTATPA
jgi:citrate lyase beta subunit